MDVVYLDLDGVLHPSSVWYEPTTRQPHLRAPGHELFESLPAFEAAIAPYKEIKVVLSTDWVFRFGYARTRDILPHTLRSRVIGATYDPTDPDAWRFPRLMRYDAIAKDARRRRPRWLAVDDDALGWPESELDALVFVPGRLGLACPDAQARLHAALAARFS